MAEQEIVDYIIQAQKHGLADFEIKQNLLNVGWEAGNVEDAFVFARAMESKTPLTAAQMSKPVNISPLPKEPVDYTPVAQNSPSPILTENSSKTSDSKIGRWKKVVFAIVLFAILAAAGGFAYYTYAFANPVKIWAKFLEAKKTAVSASDYILKYNDNSKNFGFVITGKTNSDFSDSVSPKQSNDISFNLANGGSKVDLKFSYILLGKTLYLNLSQIPILNNYLGDSDWAKLDLSAYESTTTPMTANSGQNLFSSLVFEMEKAKVIKSAKLVGREKVKNYDTFHLKNEVDSAAFANAIVNFVVTKSAAISQKSSSTPFTDKDRATLLALLSKTEVKVFDVWVGQKDSQLYKVKLNLTAPGYDDLSDPNFINAIPGISDTQSKNRDAFRLNYIRQIGNALELYSNDFGGYPDANNGTPIGLMPKYLTEIPQAPIPSDGTCTGYYNAFWYSPQGKPVESKNGKIYPSFTLTFCLGRQTGSYSEGIAKLTPKGILSNIQCPSTPEQCVADAKITIPPILATINKMKFNGEINFDSTYDYGNNVKIQPPATSTDLSELVTGLLKK